MAEKCKNNVNATLASSITATSVTLTLASGDGAQFPVIASGTANTFRISLWDKSGNVEIISICRRESGSDTLYVGTGTSHQAAGNVAGRGYESTTALAITSSDYHVIKMSPTAGQMEEALKYSSFGDITATPTEINASSVGASGLSTYDIVVKAASGVAGIAAVAATQYLKSAGVSANPAYGKLSLADTGVTLGSKTHDSGATFTETLTYQTSVVIFLNAVGSSWSIGFDDGTTHYCLYGYQDGDGHTIVAFSDSYSIYTYLQSGTYSRGYISAKNATGFTVTYSESTPGSSLVIRYLPLP